MTNAALETSDRVSSDWNDTGFAAFDEGLADARSADSGDAETDDVSVHEISELVSGALQDAMLAASQPCPDTYLDILEHRKRDSIAARLDDLPPIQLTHPVVQAEVLKELAMMRVQSELASGIIAGIQDYARSKRRALIAAMT